MEAVTLYPQSQSQYDLLLSLAREMKMRFVATKDDDFLTSLTAAAREAKQIAAGEVEAQTLDELLAEA